MVIKIKWEYVNLDFDTKESVMESIPSKEQYHAVALAIKPTQHSMGIEIARLSYDTGYNFENLKKFGEEIARRWNTCNDKK